MRWLRPFFKCRFYGAALLSLVIAAHVSAAPKIDPMTAAQLNTKFARAQTALAEIFPEAPWKNELVGVALQYGLGPLSDREMSSLMQIRRELKAYAYYPNLYVMDLLVQYVGPRAMLQFRLESTLRWLRGLKQNHIEDSQTVIESPRYRTVLSEWRTLPRDWKARTVRWDRVLALESADIPSYVLSPAALQILNYPAPNEHAVAIEPALGLGTPWPLATAMAALTGLNKYNHLTSPEAHLYPGDMQRLIFNRSVIAQLVEIYKELSREHPEFRSAAWEDLAESANLKSDISYKLISSYFGTEGAVPNAIALKEIDQRLGSHWNRLPRTCHLLFEPAKASLW